MSSMKTFKRTSILFASVLILSACGGGAKKKKEGEGNKEGDSKKDTTTEKVTTYNYKPKTTKVAITTYKHEAKNGVGIKFDSLTVNGVGSEAKSISKLLEGLSFKVPISGLNSGNAKRDKKIRKHFFGTMSSTKVIKGSVKKMSLNGSSGNAVLKISMNEKTQEVKAKLKRKEGKLTMSAEIDVMNWEGKKALDALQKACKEKHTGKNGKTKLWSTVALNISTKLDVKETLAS
ncbi:MAG: YceI family protein [Flavobacteriales bacterium]